MTATSRWAAATILCAGLLGQGAARSASPARELRGLEGLVRVYDAILAARFDQVDAALGRACAPAPAEASEVLDATAIWWRILLDPESRQLDATFIDKVERAIRTTEAWARRAPDDPEAWFYLGGAYAARVQWRVLRNEKLSAARDGKRIKESLERAIALEPGLDDAHFGVGMYKYYADVGPAALKFLRFLFLLPGGDRREGLNEMVRARDHGRLLRGEADYQLHLVYLWYERDVNQALRLLAGLHERYPTNPLFLSQIAEIQDTYQHDVTASLATWRRLLRDAQAHRVAAYPMAEVQARLGAARQLEAVAQTDDAIEHLKAVIALRPEAPYSSLPLAYLRLGEAHNRLGERAAAAEAFESAIASAATPDPLGVRTQARDRLQRPVDPQIGVAYRLSLEGWRRLEQGDVPGALRALQRSVELNPADPVARVRYGKVLRGRKDDRAALDQFELAIRAARTCPAPVLGTAYVEAAQLHESAGRRDQAIGYYRTASTLFGAASETHALADRELTRLLAAR
jgi:tetratricopeptide (TPR) repeat protein